jgi:hypothetical protein
LLGPLTIVLADVWAAVAPVITFCGARSPKAVCRKFAVTLHR